MEIEELKTILEKNDYTLVVDRKGEIYTSYLKGVAPVLNPMKEDIHFFKDAIVVDRVVGKAAAMLFIKGHIQKIHTHIISLYACQILEKYGIAYTYDECVDYIINRQGNGMCPMEETVLNIDDIDEAFIALIKKQEELMKKK